MAKYRKKPVIIEAFRYGIEEPPDWFRGVDGVWETVEYGTPIKWCEIMTPEGKMRGERGDWIIRGIQGELYPCKNEIFEQTYELVEEN